MSGILFVDFFCEPSLATRNLAPAATIRNETRYRAIEAKFDQIRGIGTYASNDCCRSLDSRTRTGFTKLSHSISRRSLSLHVKRGVQSGQKPAQ